MPAISRRVLVSALAACLAANARGAELPRHAQELRSYAGPVQDRAGSIRLRITVAGNLPQAQQAVRVGDMLLCGAAGCYRAHTAGYAQIADTSGGKAHVIADVMIPAVTISDVHFSEVVGASVIKGHLKLEPALAIERDVPAVELMIAVRKATAGGQAAWVPVESAHMVFADDSALVHYLPSVRTVATLSPGTTLTIPAGALDRARIFNVGIAKSGEMFPRVDIVPYLGLKKPGELEVRALGSRRRSRQAQVIPAGPAPHTHEAAAQDAPATQRPARITLWRTAVIEPAVLEQSLSAGAATGPGR